MSFKPRPEGDARLGKQSQQAGAEAQVATGASLVPERPAHGRGRVN